MNPFLNHSSKLALSLGLCLAVALQTGYTQTVGANTGTASATAVLQSQAAPSLTIVDEPYALFDGLVRELRAGGFVLYMRHGVTLPSTKDDRRQGAWWRDCANTQRLVPDAQPRARAIADALVRQRITVNELLTSEFCRAADTAIHFGLVPATRTPALNDISALPDARPQTIAAHAAGIKILLSNATLPKANRMLIGHALPPGLVHPVFGYLPEGNVAIFKAEGNGGFHYLTSVSPGQWQWIGKQTVPDYPQAAQAQVAQQASPQVAPAASTPAPQILIAPDKELKGAPLVQALRRGGFNLYMRHAQATVGQDGSLLQTPGWWDNCGIQRNMSDLGRDQARRVGAAIRELGIPVGQVLTAQFCRTRETGHLLGLGPVEVTEDINHQIGQRAGFDVNAARFRRLADAPPKGANTLLVSHTHGSARLEERIMGGIQEAEIVVYRPDGKGNAEPVARIPLPEWENLIKVSGPPK